MTMLRHEAFVTVASFRKRLEKLGRVQVQETTGRPLVSNWTGTLVSWVKAVGVTLHSTLTDFISLKTDADGFIL